MYIDGVHSIAREKEYWPLLCYFMYRASRYNWRLKVTSSNLNFTVGKCSPLTVRVFENRRYPDPSDHDGLVVGLAQGDVNPNSAFEPVTGLREPDFDDYTFIDATPYSRNIWAFVKLHSIEDIDRFFNDMQG